MQYLNKDGLSYLWSKIKSIVNNAQTEIGNYTINGKKISDNPTLTKEDIGLGDIENVAYVKEADKGVANGVATLGADGKIPSDQLNIDLSLYKVVSALPTEGIENNKIYLVATAGGGGTQDTYTEYIRVEDAWEKLGEYKAAVDLTPYVKFTDIASASKAGVVQLGFTQVDKKYPINVDGGKAFVEVPWTDTTYEKATDAALGLVKVGYTKTGNNYPVQLDTDGSMYVAIDLSTAVGDHQVTQAAVAATDGEFNLILGKTAGNTAQETGEVNKANGLTYNPSTKKLTVGGQVAADSVASTAAVTAGSFVKSGGTEEQVLMADGSVATPLANGDIDEICA